MILFLSLSLSRYIPIAVSFFYLSLFFLFFLSLCLFFLSFSLFPSFSPLSLTPSITLSFSLFIFPTFALYFSLSNRIIEKHLSIFTFKMLKSAETFDPFTVLLLDGSTNHVAHVWTEIGNLICLRHLFTSRAISNLIYLTQKTDFPSYVRNLFWATF